MCAAFVSPPCIDPITPLCPLPRRRLDGAGINPKLGRPSHFSQSLHPSLAAAGWCWLVRCAGACCRVLCCAGGWTPFAGRQGPFRAVYQVTNKRCAGAGLKGSPPSWRISGLFGEGVRKRADFFPNPS